MPERPFDADDAVLRGAYARMLRDIAAAPESMGPGLLTSHWPLVGAAYQAGGVLAIGQAVFGWIPEWRASELDEAGLGRVVEETRDVFLDRADPMDWIVTNRVRGSPFWRFVREVVEGWSGAGGSSWHCRVAWANLFPVAPADVPGNPTDAQCVVQRPGAASVLRAAIDLLDPGLVLVLAGPYWQGYRAHLGITGLVHADRPLYEFGEVDGRTWVVGWHPGGAQRRGWPATRYAQRVLEAARSGATRAPQP